MDYTLACSFYFKTLGLRLSIAIGTLRVKGARSCNDCAVLASNMMCLALTVDVNVSQGLDLVLFGNMDNP